MSSEGGQRVPFLSVYGHVTVDQILSVNRFPALNESVDVISKKTSLGGTGTNIAVFAAGLGVPTAICSFVGNDFPVAYEGFMRSTGLIMDEFEVAEGYETSQAIVINNSDMEQKVIFYQGPQGCASRFGNLMTGSARASKHVHFCTGEPEYYISVMKAIRNPGIRVAVDPAQEVYKMWDPDTMQRALGLSDSLFCNGFEAKIIEKYLGIDSVMSVDKPLVVCTEGSRGSIAKIDGEIVRIPLVEAASVADTTGAGDAYRAGFYAGLYRGYDTYESLVLASAVSSFAVEKVGTLSNIPDWDSVMERADRYMGA